MERLTEKIGNTNCVKGCGSNCKYGFQHCRTEDWGNCKTIDDVIEKLADYEDLEEQGRLVKLPCKVGDMVYCIYERYTKCSENEQEFDEYSCQGCECLECDSHKEHYVQSQKAYSLDWVVSNLKRFGESVFLTKSEAEAKLKELRGI